MTILVTGSTGAVGALVTRRLVESGADVKALTRSPEGASFPQNVSIVRGDLGDPDSARRALAGVRTLFLLNAVASDEMMQAITTLNLALEAGVRQIVYFSAIDSDLYTTVPHMTGKYTAERMIEQLDLPATILRPSYFMQNDSTVKDVLLGADAYPMPIGGVGIAMVDIRDIAEAAAAILLERERASETLPRETIDLISPEILTGDDVADLWSEALGRPIRYVGQDPTIFEERLKGFMPGWMAYDLRMMFTRFQAHGIIPKTGAVERFTALLGHAPRSYRSFAVEAAADWQ